MYTENFNSWAEDNLIQYEWVIENKVVEINGLGLCIIKHSSETVPLFNKEMEVNASPEEKDFSNKTQAINWIFEFGGSWFYSPIKSATIKFLPLENVGEAYQQTQSKDYCFLGVHGRYESMSGTREYSDWCKKAQFLGISQLGICERGTLAGTLPFQSACKKANIKPIIGYTARIEDDRGEVYEIKLFVKNTHGWITLLNLHNKANVESEGLIQEIDFKTANLQDLVIVLPPTETVFKKINTFLKSSCQDLYWQFTTNEQRSNARDIETLNVMKKFMSQYKDIPCILLTDAYVLNRRDTAVRRRILTIGKRKVDDDFENGHGHFKSIDEQAFDVDLLFQQGDEEKLNNLFKRGIQSTKEVADLCCFEIDTKKLHLPKYEMTRVQKRTYSSTEEMFDSLIDKGRTEYLIREELRDPRSANSDLPDTVQERIEKEADVIKRGGFVDYFLILWDIVQWCEREGIQIGPGRGSAAGSLVSYLLGIVKIDPLAYDLLFERFLNESRIESSMPDIDIDFASDRREDVVQYMKERYGVNFVCRVGTYGTLQMRGLFGDFNRYYGALPTKDLQYLSKMIDEDNTNWGALFIDSAKKSKLKSFVKQNVSLVNDCRLALGCVKSTSTHASAIVIFPKNKDEKGKEIDIFSQIPIRVEEGEFVSEWEGTVMEKAGFLKEDILSTQQMAKFGEIFNLINERYGEKIKTTDIPFDDEAVFELFREGLTQDVFHFGSEGLTNYLIQVQPKTFEELIASIALYRPGAISSKAHEDYIKLKKGEIEPKYDYFLKSVTQETYGLYIYQEQVMKAAQVLGNFSLSDADGIRKAMGKKIKDLMDGYKVQFVKNAIENKCSEQEANDIWDKMEVFSGYGFNKSHAAAYAAIGYYCNWLKQHYPLEFWTVAFDLSSEDHIPSFLSEINRGKKITVAPPDINQSQIHFYSDPNKNTIYWSIGKISYVGDVATTHILDVRNAGGKFFSMADFLDRVEKGKVNRRVLLNLILAGCFDEMYQIQKQSDRRDIVLEAFRLREEDVPEIFLGETAKHDYFWSMQQMEVAKLGDMNYSKLINTLSIFKDKDASHYVTPESFHSNSYIGKDILVAGIVTEVEERQATNGKFATITMVNGDHEIKVRVWGQLWENSQEDERYETLRSDLLLSKNRIFVIKGKLEGASKYHAHNMLYAQHYKQGALYEIF